MNLNPSGLEKGRTLKAVTLKLPFEKEDVRLGESHLITQFCAAVAPCVHRTSPNKMETAPIKP